MGSPFPGSMAMPDVPDHALMTVNAQGGGPADPGDTADIVCWCGQPECRKFLATVTDAQAAFWAALEALKTQDHEAITPQLLEARGIGELGEGERIGIVQCGDTEPHGLHLWHGYYRLCRGRPGHWPVGMEPVRHLGQTCSVECFREDGSKRPHA